MFGGGAGKIGEMRIRHHGAYIAWPVILVFGSSIKGNWNFNDLKQFIPGCNMRDKSNSVYRFVRYSESIFNPFKSMNFVLSYAQQERTTRINTQLSLSPFLIIMIYSDNIQDLKKNLLGVFARAQ